MGYSDQLKGFRASIDTSIVKKDTQGLKIGLIGYSKVLRAMANELKSYMDRAYLNATADKYEQIAVLVAKEGISERVLTAIKTGGKSLSEPSATKKAADVPPKGNKTEMPSTSVDVPPPPAKASEVPPKAHAKPAEPIVPPAPNKPAETPLAPPAPVASDDQEWSADIFEKYSPATAVINTECAGGTGFFISDKGYLITNHHVVYTGNHPDSIITITTGDKRIRTNAKLIDADQKADVALLYVEGLESNPYIPLVKDYSEVRAGSDVVIIGNGLSFGLAPVSGIIKFPHKSELDNDLVYTAMTNSGDSGSPIINRHGECVGIHKAREDERGRASARGIAYGTPADVIFKLLEKWSEKHGLNI